jgi:fatty-acyl-CoA synthase
MHERGLMMDPPLLIASILEHGAAQNANVEIVSRETEGSVFRYTVAQSAARARRLANALAALGLSRGDMVASVAWSNHRHLEAYFAVSGSGLVMHTCNPRLHTSQLIYIINHADDRAVLFDVTFVALIEAIAPQCPRVKAWVCLTDAARMPVFATLRNVLCYEDMLAAQDEVFVWPQFDERLGAALCYTSGTTGNPKGAFYSHRAMVLNAMMICTPSVIGLSPRETALPIVPMFHINGWCMPYAALIAGAKLVLPGPRLDGASIYDLIQSEHVTVSAGVPTVWLQLLQHVEQHDLRFSSLRRIVAGGGAMPTALTAKLVDNYGLEVRQGWGMTETVAVATISMLDAEQMTWPAARRHALISRQGKSVFGIEIKVVDDRGATLPRDGESQGELLVRGQWIASGYYKSDTSPLIDGWFPTGDIATIDPQGVMQIRDRAKDLIKTGGEWISSLDVENTATAHPEVAAAAVIGVRHPKWQERPLLFVVRKPHTNVSREAILEFLAQRLARWWVPDDVIFLDSLPVGGTGKVQKTVLREKYGNVFD